MKLFGAHAARAIVLIRACGVMMISCVWMVQAAQANDFEITEIIPSLNSRCATEDYELLEQYLRCGRRDRHRFLLLYLSVPFSHCASSARSCLAPEVLFLWSTPWTSVGFASLSLTLAKGRVIIDAPPVQTTHPHSTTSTAAN